MSAPSRISARAIIIIENHLLVERHRLCGVCFPPCGRTEEGESPADALARELLEELGDFNFVIGGYLGHIASCWREGATICDSFDHFYRVSTRDLHPRSFITPREAGREVVWVPIEAGTSDNVKPTSLIELLRNPYSSAAPWSITTSDV